MKPTALVLAALLAPVASAQVTSRVEGTSVVLEGGTGPGSERHVVLVAGDEEYRSEEVLPQLAKILSVRHGFRCTVLFSTDPETGVIDPDASSHIAGLGVLEEADLLVLFTRFRHLPDVDMAHVVRYVERGGPIVGIRTATHAFAYPDDSTSPFAHWSWQSKEWPGGFGKQVLGETWVNHHGAHGAESTGGFLPEAARSHPILRGVVAAEIWGPTDVYGIRDLPADATVLVEGVVLDGMTVDAEPVAGPKNEPRMPIVWSRERRLPTGAFQRVVCSTIGAAPDFASVGVRRVLVNAVFWGAGLEVPASADVTLVGEFDPTAFGFGGFVRGVRPEHHLL